MNDLDQNKLKAALTAKLEEANNREAASNIMALLFPKAESALRTFVAQDTEEDKKKIRQRLAERDFATRYFSLGPTDGSWGQSEFEAAVRSSPDKAFELLQQKVDAAPAENRSDIRRIFLELLDSRFGPTEPLDQEWLNAIVSASPQLLLERDVETRSLFSVDNEDRIRWIITHGLRDLSPATRATILKSAIKQATDLTVLTDVIRSLVGDVRPEGTRGRRDEIDLSNEGDNIRALLLERVREAASTGSIWKNAKPDRLLWFWWGTGADSEVKSFTAKALNSDAGLRILLDATVNRVQSSAGDYDHVQKSWDMIVDLETLRQYAEKLAGPENREADIKLAQRFLSALQRSREDPF